MREQVVARLGRAGRVTVVATVVTCAMSLMAIVVPSILVAQQPTKPATPPSSPPASPPATAPTTQPAPSKPADSSHVPLPTAPQSPLSAVPMTVTQPITDTVDRIVAVVGGAAITYSDLITAVNQQRASGMQLPQDAAGQYAFAKQVLGTLVDEEILVQKAHELKLEVSETDVASAADQQLRGIRSQFSSDNEYRTELKKAGFGTPEEYRRTLFDQIRRHQLQQKAYRELAKGAKPGSVTEEEVNAAYERARSDLQKRPAMVAFRQIVLAPRASAHADSVAKAKAESLLVKLKAGANFEEMAKRESMDPGTAKLGGDLGWNRRGSGFVPEFEAAMFRLPPGQLSPVVKTSFGYHIIRVDRVQPAEVKVRHILIAPVIDSADLRATQVRADSVAEMWRRGANFDSLVAKYHDASEEKGVLQPFPVDSLPPSYQTAISNVKINQISAPFALSVPNGTVKYAIVEIVARTEPGEYSLAEVRERIRQELSAERQYRDVLDEMRKQTYVSLRL